MKNGAKIFLAFFIATFSLRAQTPSNLSLFLQGVDSVATLISQECTPSASYSFNLSPQEKFSVFKIHLLTQLREKGIKISDTSKVNKIGCSVEVAEVNYSQPFREKFLGDFLVERRAVLKGSYYVETDGIVNSAHNFNFVWKDKIPYDKLTEVGSPLYKFTQGAKPEIPFLSSFFEPAIALSAVIIAIYLLFTVRSK